MQSHGFELAAPLSGTVRGAPPEPHTPAPRARSRFFLCPLFCLPISELLSSRRRRALRLGRRQFLPHSLSAGTDKTLFSFKDIWSQPRFQPIYQSRKTATNAHNTLKNYQTAQRRIINRGTASVVVRGGQAEKSSPSHRTEISFVPGVLAAAL